MFEITQPKDVMLVAAMFGYLIALYYILFVEEDTE